MLQVAGLSHSYWEEAIATANYIQNWRFTCTLSMQTPYELWHGTKPDLSNLCVFGCPAYAFIPKEKCNKLDAKAVKTIFIGYGDHFGHKAYRLYNPLTRQFIFSRSVTFNKLALLCGENDPDFGPASPPRDPPPTHTIWDEVVSHIMAEALNNPPSPKGNFLYDRPKI